MKKLSILLVLTMLCACLCPWMVSAEETATDTAFFAKFQQGNDNDTIVNKAGSQKFLIYYGNEIGEPKTVVATVTNKDGNVVWTKTQTVTTAEADGTDEGRTYTTFDPQITEYGTYTLTVTNTTDDTVLITKNFGVANLADEGEYSSRFGLASHIGSQADPELAKELSRKAGINQHRAGFYWNRIEKEEGVYDFSNASVAAPDKITDDGLEYIVTLGFGNPLYFSPETEGDDWLEEWGDTWSEAYTMCTFPRTKKQREAFVNYAVALATEYNNVAPGSVTKFLVWNELNGNSHFNKTGATAEDYATLVKELYPAVKAVNPSFEIVIGATAYGANENEVNYQTFISQVLAVDGMEDCYDAVSVHPYTFIEEKLATRPTEAHITEITKVRNMLHSDKKLYYTECGTSITNTTATAGTDEYNNWGTEMFQAEYAIKMYAEALGNNLGEQFWWHNLVNNAYKADQPYESTFGLFTNKGSDAAGTSLVIDGPKPAYITIAGMNKLLWDAEFDKKYDDVTNLSAYSFQKADGSDVAVMWSAKDTESDATLYLGTSNVTIYDKYTNEIATMESTNGVYSITDITDSPIYVVGDFSDFRESSGAAIEVSVSGKDAFATGETPAFLVEGRGGNDAGSVTVTVTEGAETIETVALNVPAKMAKSVLVEIPNLAEGTHTLTFTATSDSATQTVTKTVVVGGSGSGTVGGANTVTVENGIVTITGTTAPLGYVSFLVLDQESKVAEIRQLTADVNGNYTDTYELPAEGIYTVKVNNGALNIQDVNSEDEEEPAKKVEYSVANSSGTIITDISELVAGTYTVTVNTNGLFEATDDVYCVIYNGAKLSSVQAQKVDTANANTFTVTIAENETVTDMNVFVWRVLTPVSEKFNLLTTN